MWFFLMLETILHLLNLYVLFYTDLRCVLFYDLMRILLFFLLIEIGDVGYRTLLLWHAKQAL